MDWLILVMGVVIISLAYAHFDMEEPILFMGLMLFGIGWVLWHTRTTPEEAAAQEAAQRARETPHIVRQGDGCDVYAFEHDNRTHYFTRCADRTATETHWTERHGKHTVERVDTIDVTIKPNPALKPAP